MLKQIQPLNETFTVGKPATFERIAVGTYQATFRGVERIETKNGKAYRWTFETADKKLISEISDAENAPSIGNRTGRWLMALSGIPFTSDVNINPYQYIGKKYLVIVNQKMPKQDPITFSALP